MKTCVYQEKGHGITYIIHGVTYSPSLSSLLMSQSLKFPESGT